MIKRVLGGVLAVVLIFGAVMACRTVRNVQAIPDSLSEVLAEVRKPQLVDREGRPLTVTYANRWNCSSYVPLHQVPEVLRKAFILSEDKTFYSHGGVDWSARLHAVFQNLMAFHVVRGASTISEQVVRMIHSRPRTLWARWLEGFEATRLEKKHAKDEILEFYLNQVPYAANRRGVSQAAHYYFNRTPDTLSLREMLALVILVRAPSSYDLYRNPGAIDSSIRRFAERLHHENILNQAELDDVVRGTFSLKKPGHDIDAGMFAHYVYSHVPDFDDQGSGEWKTSLDGTLQNRVASLIERALHDLSSKKVKNGACLVADHQTGEILAWVSLGIGDAYTSGSEIDGVTTPRQPGSSMKPFLYALSLEKGWTAAEEINDQPLTNAVGRGLHTYHNYSHVNYGFVTLREALGNSLNIPAIKTVRFVGHSDYLNRLHDLGYKSLDKHPEYYGDGLALGCGEVTLLETVQAYACLANRGIFRPLTFGISERQRVGVKRVFSEEVASLIGNILSDPEARELEFGHGGMMNFPVQTAIKTGTSTDYRDSWAIGYNYRYVAGIWVGNFDAVPMDGVTGSTGPAFILRSVFAELTKNRETRSLYFSPKLVQKEICVRTGDGKGSCVKRHEWFINNVFPDLKEPVVTAVKTGFVKPVNGLEMAMDPRIPDRDEAFEFQLAGVDDSDRVVWTLDGHRLGEKRGGTWLWPLKRGRHVVEASVFKPSGVVHDHVTFVVK